MTTRNFAKDLRPRIIVVGVGGAGGNAVNNMIRLKLEGVDFRTYNTDAQALEHSLADHRVQLGLNVTKGLGAGSNPAIGSEAAEESLKEIIEDLSGSNMVFIAAGMGGGTGTGAGPVIARAAREQGILTVGVVTKPFHFEGAHRMRTAEAGIGELQKYVDTLIVIPNQNLFRIANERTTFAEAFNMADDVLYSGVRGVTDLMIMPGLINLDFADVKTVMSEMGKAMMGTGEAEGDRRALDAAEAAISNPLLDEISMAGARGILINITGGLDMTLFEVDEAANRIREEVSPDANIIFGSTFDERLNGRIRVSVVATGIDVQQQVAASSQKQQAAPKLSVLNQPLDLYADPLQEFDPELAALSENVVALEEAIELETPATEGAIEENKTAEEKDDSLEEGILFSLKTEETEEPQEEKLPFFKVERSEDYPGPQPMPRKSGLFARLTGFGKKRPVEREEESRLVAENQPQLKPVRSANSTPEVAEDQLDIPAFLRRNKK